ncbi:MAG: hypothetical protein II843_01050 [Alphaproteobacteria bacterium]|nr:hypothetical protein [Alphaproteobacteria bacterium]MBQ4471887.1 hypothetical protein [Alphaproteobacteria bacterium]
MKKQIARAQQISPALIIAGGGFVCALIVLVLWWAGFFIVTYDSSEVTTTRRDGVYMAFHRNTNKPVTGYVVSHHRNGQIADKSYYKNGKEDGHYTFWNSNGTITSESDYKDGIMFARKQYDDNGNLEEEIDYRQCGGRGTFKKKYDKKTHFVVNEGCYYGTFETPGRLHTIYYPNSTQIRSEIEYGVYGRSPNDPMPISRLDGAYKIYYKNGKIFVDTSFEDGKLSGDLKVYDIFGNVRYQEKYEKGKVVPEESKKFIGTSADQSKEGPTFDEMLAIPELKKVIEATLNIPNTDNKGSYARRKTLKEHEGEWKVKLLMMFSEYSGE